jgi:hypothetical protein
MNGGGAYTIDTLRFKVYHFSSIAICLRNTSSKPLLVLSRRRTKMSKTSGNFSRNAAIRKSTFAVLGLCVLFAAPASFAQRAGALGPITLYDYRQAETAPSCTKAIAPSIPEQDISKRFERQVKRDMRAFLDETVNYLACVRAAFRVGEANDAPDSQLLRLIDENNATVKQVDELAAIYEERIGPIRNVLLRARVANSPVRPGFSTPSQPAPGFTDRFSGVNPGLILSDAWKEPGFSPSDFQYP